MVDKKKLKKNDDCSNETKASVYIFETSPWARIKKTCIFNISLQLNPVMLIITNFRGKQKILKLILT